MEQNTEDWLRWRHAGIGSSDANCIMNPKYKYKKRSQLLLEKQTPFGELENKDSGPIADLGHSVEELERARFELMMDVKVFPTLKQSDETPYIRASYDGLSENEDLAWEHKLMGQKMFEELENGICPKDYYPQIQQQIYVSPKLAGVWLCAILYNQKEMFGKKLDPAEFKRAKMFVPRDEAYIKKLLKENKKFWSEVQEKKDWSAVIKLARKKTRIKNLIKKLEKKAKELDPFIIEHLHEAGGSLSTPTFDMSYTKGSREGIDKEKLIEDNLFDKYKKESVSYTLRITERKRK